MCMYAHMIHEIPCSADRQARHMFCTVASHALLCGMMFCGTRLCACHRGGCFYAVTSSQRSAVNFKLTWLPTLKSREVEIYRWAKFHLESRWFMAACAWSLKTAVCTRLFRQHDDVLHSIPKGSLTNNRSPLQKDWKLPVTGCIWCLDQRTMIFTSL